MSVLTLPFGTNYAHGNLPGGALHALATTAAAGFMSPSDKQVLDSMPTLPEFFGAKGDGDADDTDAFQLAFDSGASIKLVPGRRYKIRKTVHYREDYQVLDGAGATILMDTEDGAFDNADINEQFSEHAIGFRADDLDFIVMRNCTIRPTAWRDCTYLAPVHFDGCSSGVIQGNDFSLFARGPAVISIVDCPRISIDDNDIHECYTLSAFEIDGVTATTSRNVQITGISIDDNATTGSPGFSITSNNIWDLTNSAAILAALGNVQSDGITVRGTDGKSRDGLILGNSIRNVAEGIDGFCATTVIQNNNISDCLGAGIKIFHGASGNQIAVNLLKNIGLAGIYTGGSNASAFNAKDNHYFGNKIDGINLPVNWYDAIGDILYESVAGSTFWTDVFGGGAGSITAGIRIDVSGQTITGAAKTSSTTVTLTYIGSDTYVVGRNAPIFGVVGMTELNGNSYPILSTNPTLNTILIETPDNTTWGAYTSGGRISNTSQCEGAYFHDNHITLGGNADRGFFMEGSEGGFRNIVGPHEIRGVRPVTGRRYQDSGNYCEFINQPHSELAIKTAKTLPSDTAANSIFNSPFNIEAGLFEIEMEAFFTNISAVSGTMSFTLGGTATVGAGTLVYLLSSRGTGVGTPQKREMTNAGPVDTGTASVQTAGQVTLKGRVAISISGTLDPQISFSQASAVSVSVGSSCRVKRVSNANKSGPDV